MTHACAAFAACPNIEKGGLRVWLESDSVFHRPAITQLWLRYQTVIVKEVRNVLNPMLVKWYNADGTKPGRLAKESKTRSTA